MQRMIDYRIGMTAANIIKEDIQKMAYYSNMYKGLDEIATQTLNMFMDIFMKKKKTDLETVRRKSTVIAHAIISRSDQDHLFHPYNCGLGLPYTVTLAPDT